MQGIVVYLSKNGDKPERIAFESRLSTLLAAAGARVIMMPHLYHIPEDSAAWAQLAESLPHAVLSWLYARPAQWILNRHITLPDTTTFIDMKDYETPEECIEALRLAIPRPESEEEGTIEFINEAKSKRWYPVIDYSRCVACRQCEQFCLFEVYTCENGRVAATSPDNCKDGCPACSRICPRGAIMFPLYEDAPIAGAPGTLMQPDRKAKVLFYRRTGKKCPQCGGSYAAASIADMQPTGGTACDECGLPAAGRKEPPPKASDDLDLLIDDLENLR